MHVLVIDDSDTDFRIVERALGDQFAVYRELTLGAGLAIAARRAFDLVILDLTLSDSHGFETFEKAIAALPRTPILILSGLDDDDLALRAVSAGAQDYIRKSRLSNCPLDRVARYAVERSRVESAMRESERFARATVNSLSAHIAIIDDSGTILAVNNSWKRFATENGLLPANSDGVGTNYLTACDQSEGNDVEIAHIAAAGIRSIFRGERSDFFLEYPCHSPTEERWFMMRTTPFDGEGPLRVVVAHENITSRKIAERLAQEQCGLREAVAGMEQVLGVVGHELRTPLAALRAISEFLMTDGARNTAEASQFMREISEEVDRMSDTVNNLLEAARINSGRARWNWSEVDVSEIIREAISSIEPLIDSRRVRIGVITDDTAQYMMGDADAIRRLLINLLSNARKHTPRGSIDVTLRKYADAGGSWIELGVSDTGYGIPPEITARLGEAFALNSGVVGSNHISGTGLGLAICSGIANAHGGNLLIKSVQGQGTTVTARLRSDLDAAANGDTVPLNSYAEVAV